MTPLEQLIALIPPPSLEANETDCAVVFNLLGVAPPADYVAFIDTYGGGDIEGIVRVFDPASISPDTHPIHQLLTQIVQMNRGQKFVPFDPLFVPFGVARDGTLLYFVQRSGAASWQVATGAAGAPPDKFKRLSVSMTELVLGMVTGKRRVGKVSKSAARPRFNPAARATAPTARRSAAKKRSAARRTR